jgi:transposase
MTRSGQEEDGQEPRRRSWSLQDKVRIVTESYDPRTTVSAVARKHAINRNQLFSWRRQLRGGLGPPLEALTAAPVPLMTLETASEPGPPAGPLIELLVGRILVRVGPEIDPMALRRVLEVVRALE